jgi:hypothetical protein
MAPTGAAPLPGEDELDTEPSPRRSGGTPGWDFFVACDRPGVLGEIASFDLIGLSVAQAKTLPLRKVDVIRRGRVRNPVTEARPGGKICSAKLS